MIRSPILYYAQKLLIFLLSLLILSVAVFYISRLAPGDPLVSYYGERAENMSPRQRAWAEERLGLNDPLHVQYLRWVENALRGDFGISYKYKTDVLQVIGGRVGNTLLLGGMGFVLIFALALGLGLLCARYEGSVGDRILCRVGTALGCVPEFWLSLVLILVFSVYLGWLPSSGAYPPGGADSLGGRARHLMLPLSVVVIGHVWYYAYMIRNRLAEEGRQDYVLLGKAKGLSRRQILYRHCLRNSLPAYLSMMAVSLPHVLGGTYIVETVFSYPGLGTLSYESARYQDYNLLMLLSILSGTLVILSGLAARILQERIDPRVRGRGRRGG